MRILTIICSFAAITLFGDTRWLVNGTAANVGNEVFTIQDAQFYDSIGLFVTGDPKPVRFEQQDALKRVVERMLLGEVLNREMNQLQFAGIPKADAERELRQKIAAHRVLWQELLKAFNRTESDAILLFWKTQKAERFMRQKVATLSPVVTDAEVERYFETHYSRGTGNNLAVLRPTIVAALRKQQTQKGLDEWMQSLKEKHSALNLLDES